MDEAQIYMTIGELKGRIEALERQVAELQTRPASAPSSGGGGKEKKWFPSGEVTGTITHAARGLDKNNKTILVLWNSTAGRRVNIFPSYDKKVDWTDWFNNHLQKPIGSLPLLEDIKGKDTTNMVTVKHFMLTQTKLEAEGEQYPKYESKFVEFPPTGGQTNHAPQPTTAPDYFLEAWEKYRIPEEVARALIPTSTPQEAREMMEYLGQKILNENYQKILKDVNDYAFNTFMLSEAQVKEAMEWANDPKDTSYAFYPTKASKQPKLVWHWFYVVILSVDRLRKMAERRL